MIDQVPEQQGLKLRNDETTKRPKRMIDQVPEQQGLKLSLELALPMRGGP